MLKKNQFLPIMIMSIFFSGCTMTETSNNAYNWKGLIYMSVQEMFPNNPHAQALALAAEHGDIEEIDRLIDAGADPNATGTYGVALSQWLLLHPNKAGFRRLLEKGVDPNKIWYIHYQGTEEQTSLIHETTERTQFIGPDYLLMVLEVGKGNPNLIPPDNMYRPIDMAIKQGNEKAFAILYNAGAIVNYNDKCGLPLLLNSALSGNYEISLFLLEIGIEYNTENTNCFIKDIKQIIDSVLACHNRARDTTSSQYMWFWRCVDFLEKRGMVFDYTPYKNRPPAVKPTELDTTPPLSNRAPIERMPLPDSVLMHEVELTYPVPFWAQTLETMHNVQERQSQSKGKLSNEYLPLGQTPENWKALMTVTSLYSPGVSFREFIETVRNQHSGNECMIIEETGDHQICKISSKKGQPVDAIQYLGKFENTFVIVWQAWDSSNSATATDYESKALAGARRIVMKKGMHVVPLD